ncbi:hypothetical protein CY34DRAFT_813114 [Suillus luteus UH-Slu-Lm8-n1]|uniref:Uncharacterized protein n=1 Tax=Suillus luteus UH-Slu-Lm8-n1 TaxID=930992 RepID=A0A0D0AIQ1_9AGAM|nr:hypothetical protein CY34DRAFT_813114 [Suillus luteus UH-Slu-Lm8-n1]
MNCLVGVAPITDDETAANRCPQDRRKARKERGNITAQAIRMPRCGLTLLGARLTTFPMR